MSSTYEQTHKASISSNVDLHENIPQIPKTSVRGNINLPKKGSQTPKTPIRGNTDLCKMESSFTYDGIPPYIRGNTDLDYSKSLITETTTETTTDIIKKIKQKNKTLYFEIEKKLENYTSVNPNAFFEWIDYKATKNIVVINKILKELDSYDFDVQQQMVDNSIRGEYKNLFPIVSKSTPNDEDIKINLEELVDFELFWKNQKYLCYCCTEYQKNLIRVAYYREDGKLDELDIPKQEFYQGLIVEDSNLISAS